MRYATALTRYQCQRRVRRSCVRGRMQGFYTRRPMAQNRGYVATFVSRRRLVLLLLCHRKSIAKIEKLCSWTFFTFGTHGDTPRIFLKFLILFGSRAQCRQGPQLKRNSNQFCFLFVREIHLTFTAPHILSPRITNTSWADAHPKFLFCASRLERSCPATKRYFIYLLIDICTEIASKRVPVE